MLSTMRVPTISIHVPTWGTTAKRPCKGYEYYISIHVPTWGTTAQAGSRKPSVSISIHVPTWGTTYHHPEKLLLTDHFNPRSHVGNDSFFFFPFMQPTISIHVPTWGTTDCTVAKRLVETYFNPRSHVGNDSKFSQIFFAFLCNKYNFSTFYYPFSLFFGVIHFTFLIFAVRILPIFYVYF